LRNHLKAFASEEESIGKVSVWVEWGGTRLDWWLLFVLAWLSEECWGVLDTYCRSMQVPSGLWFLSD
jgi:hypothetical protein